MLVKPLSTWIVSKQSDNYTYYFDPESAMLAYQYSVYPDIVVASIHGENVYCCLTCGSLPQLYQTKTGKYFCTCPSSFIGGGEDCDPGEKFHDIVIIPKDTPVFDTISEAIKQWNDKQSCNQDRIILHDKISNKEITDWKQIYSYLFDEKMGKFACYCEDTYMQVCILCRLLKVNTDFYGVELLTQMLKQNEKVFNKNIKILCKIILEQFNT